MGMYDEIQCDAPVPDGYSDAGERYQIKSFPDPRLQRYKITRSGKLIDVLDNDLGPDGYIVFYIEDRDSIWREYRARFVSSQLQEIVRVNEDDRDPIRYRSGSYLWFSAPSFLFDDDDENSEIEG